MQQIIQIEKIEDGMVLAEPVLNQFSQVLLPSGTILSNFHTKILQKWNINYVFIYKDTKEDEAAIPQEILDECKELVSSKLLWTPSNPIELDLLKTAATVCASNKLNNQLTNATN